MGIQSARENAALDSLVGRARVVRDVTTVLEGHGMPTTDRAVTELLAGLAQRGLVSRSGAAYQITTAGRDSVRRRKGGYAPRAG
jgi:hypothetical protein